MLVRLLRTAPARGAWVRAFASKSGSESSSLMEKAKEAHLEKYRTKKRPMKSTEMREREGLNVTHPWNRYSDDYGELSLSSLRDASRLSDVTENTSHRVATIYMPSRHAMENDRNSMKYWTMKFGQKQKWGHPLMGWMGGDDTMKQLTEKLRFESLEQAIQFCERNGWKFRVQRPAPEKNPDIDNRYEQTILPKAVSTEMNRLGPRKARRLFSHTARSRAATTWPNLKRSDYGSDAWKPIEQWTLRK